MMRNRFTFLAASAILALAATSATAQQQRSLNPRDVQESQRQHPELLKEFGGAETGPRAQYVEEVGRRVAYHSGVANPGQSFHFTTLNSAVENAFALPGGYVYITRQLMALMEDESELAFVLGHETGHIAADHSRTRRSAATRNSILGVLGAILGGVVGNNAFGNLISQGAMQYAQMATLSFSREQEYQADTLGTRYMIAAGYDPLGGPRLLASLGRANALESRIQGRDSRSTPEWASTHPLSENRTRRADAEARRTGRAGQGITNRDRFLSMLDGVYVDDDPEQGIIEGNRFTHPDLGMQFVIPQGFLMQNGTRAVSISGTAGQAQFSGGQFTGSMDQYINQVVYGLTKGQVQVYMSQPQWTNINGLQAMYSVGRANTRSGAVDVGVMAYRWDRDTVYHFVTLTRGGYGMQPFTSMLNSLRRISPQEASAIRPRVIDIVTVRPGDTAQSLSRRMAYRDYQMERFLTLNDMAANDRLQPGEKVKLVVYGNRRRT